LIASPSGERRRRRVNIQWNRPQIQIELGGGLAGDQSAAVGRPRIHVVRQKRKQPFGTGVVHVANDGPPSAVS
jgi:hypothetical protein